MSNKEAKMGFTLIELLVVVLIIGILASVALPQYNKAVRKARLSEVATTFSSISKGIDAWLLENGGFGSAQFSGTSKNAELDVSFSCSSEGLFTCSSKVGSWSYLCVSSQCNIFLWTGESTENKWLAGATLQWSKSGDGPWRLVDDGLTQSSASISKELCDWWKAMYGETILTSCGYYEPSGSGREPGGSGREPGGA